MIVLTAKCCQISGPVGSPTDQMTWLCRLDPACGLGLSTAALNHLSCLVMSKLILQPSKKNKQSYTIIYISIANNNITPFAKNRLNINSRDAFIGFIVPINTAVTQKPRERSE